MQQVSQKQNLFVLAVVAVNVLPQYSTVPMWVYALCLGSLIWRLAYEFQKAPLPGRVFRWVLMGTSFLMVWVHFDSVVTQEAGVAILVLASGIKLLELAGYRDLMSILIICILLLMVKLLDSQTFAATLFMFLDVFLIAMVLFRIHQPEGVKVNPKKMIRPTLRIFLVAAPMFALLFVLFPRISGRYLPGSLSKSVGMGFDNKMNPGDIAELSQDERLSFRVRFPGGRRPPRSELYWRAGTFSQSDGMYWYNDENSPIVRHQRVRGGTQVTQEFLIEPGNQKWLFGLDHPFRLIFNDRRIHRNVYQRSDGSFGLTKDLPKRSLYFVRSQLRPKFEELASNERAQFLQTSDTPTRLLEKLLESWREQSPSVDDYPDTVMEYFRTRDYVYSLKPGRMNSRSVGEFMISLRKGFCEHYAAAFASIMRHLGVPARVVFGFQGGEYNDFDGFYSVTMKDAHAWTEVWSDERSRWVRYDPTAVIAPSRIDLGGQGFANLGIDEVSSTMRPEFNSQDGLILRRIKLALDAVSNRWNLFLLQYDYAYQRQILENLGFKDIGAGQMMGVILMGIPILFMFVYWRGRRRVTRKDEYEKIFEDFCDAIEKHGVVRKPYEGALTIGQRAASQIPQAEHAIIEFASRYVKVRYGGLQSKHVLREDLRNLKRELKKVA